MKISIITINLNNAKGLKKTINSVCAQNYSDIEYILIDGGSTDESLAIIQDSADKLHYWISEKDNGIYPAMNKGIKKAGGDYLLFLNSGDSFTTLESVSKAVAYFSDEDIIYGDINAVKNNEIVRTEIYPDKLNLTYFIDGAIPHQAMFIKKSLFKRVGDYSESLKITSDWKFQIDAICKHKCAYKHIPLTITDFCGDGLSSAAESQRLIKHEKETVLLNEYAMFKADLHLQAELKSLHLYYRNSNRVKWLQKLNILKRFSTWQSNFKA